MREPNFQERRDSVRVARIVTVRHRLYKRDNKKRDDIWQLATTEDMSYSGLRFTSALPYQESDIVELQVVMSGVLYLFNGFGKVVRVIKSDNEFFQVAVKYVDLKYRHRDAKSLLASASKKSAPKNSSTPRKAAHRK